MHPVLISIILSITAYLIGSIPSSVWIGKWFFNTDIRDHGSGNAGTTNTFRVLGTFPGIIVFALDIFKGFLAVSLVYLAHQYIPETTKYVNFELLLGGLAVLGHIFPIYAGFRGGKGVATLLGIVLAIHPIAALISLSIFILVLSITKYVSLSSMIAGLIFPFLIIFIFKESIISLIIFSIVISILLIVTHQKNIVRLLAREENKVRFRRDKNQFRSR
ncbi:MAG: glycerol-3-phosphate 1-O-acyltransferase PlsY [Salinivirgaceae bacterium]|jgi:glycerol-3-phosphate acyltransferase PlsY|nr:glycerol-3-phosphate 1-O-acyltransferase PlsY [Salinivirgaceae bacterium]